MVYSQLTLLIYFVFSYADTEPVMFCLSPEENRNQKQQPTATAAASYLDILNWEKSALPTVTTVARVSKQKSNRSVTHDA